ncbi:MAG: hypothetical protein ACLQHS_07850 [Candidatus Limnocylindrales bacterium]
MPPFTASDVIAIVAIIVGPVIGLITGLRLQGAQAKSDREKSRIERVQANRAATYVDLLEHVYRTQDYVTRTLPFVSFTGDPGPPDFPPDDVMRRLNARVAAFGSPDVLGRLEALFRFATEFSSAVFVLNMYRNAPPGGLPSGQQAADERRELEAKRKAFLDAAKDLRDAVNRELAE